MTPNEHRHPTVPKPEPREAYTITVIPTDDGPLVHQRLKRLLKVLLRGYHLRCVRIAPERPPDPPGATDGTGLGKAKTL